jgi:hypothetical protein
MSVQILSLATGQLITTSQTVLYTSPVGPPALTSIVKSIRLVNTTSSPVTVNLYLNRNSGTGSPDTRHLIPLSMSVPGNSAAIDDQEITMASGDIIKGDASVNTVVDFVISGIQR